MNKPFLILFSAYLFFTNQSIAQNNGIIPLTGIKYFKEGIGGNIDVRVDGFLLLNNRIALNKEIEIRLQSPTGFTDKNKLFYPAAEVIILTSKGEVLSKVSNMMKESEKGFSTITYKDVVLKLALPPAVIKKESACTIKVRFYDLKSSKQLRIEFPVVINKSDESLLLSKTATQLKPSGSLAFANGVKIKSMKISVDTTIKVSPKMVYASVILEDIEGTSMNEILAGKESFWVYDNNMNEVKITDKLLKQVKGALEDNIVKYTVKIPFRLKSNRDKYTVRFRWESRDIKKVIDVAVNY